MREDFAKFALAACVSAILTGAAAWFTFGNSKITRGEMVEYVADQVSKQAIPLDLRLATTESDTKELQDLFKAQTQQINGLTVELRSFVAEIRASK